MHIDSVAHPMDEIGEMISDFLLNMINSKESADEHKPINQDDQAASCR